MNGDELGWGGTEGSHMRAESPQDMLSTFGMGA